MPTLTIDPDDVKFSKRPAVLQPTGEERWSLRCMSRCGWAPKEEFQRLEAAFVVGQHHTESTGHPVATEGWIKVKGDTIRAKAVRS